MCYIENNPIKERTTVATLTWWIKKLKLRFRHRASVEFVSNVVLTLLYYLIQSHSTKTMRPIFSKSLHLARNFRVHKGANTLSHSPRKKFHLSHQTISLNEISHNQYHFAWYFGIIKMTMQTEAKQINLNNQCKKRTNCSVIFKIFCQNTKDLVTVSYKLKNIKLIFT